MDWYAINHSLYMYTFIVSALSTVVSFDGFSFHHCCLFLSDSFESYEDLFG